MNNNTDNPAIQRLLLVLVLIFGAVFLAVQGVKSGNHLLMGLVFAIPLGIYFLVHPSALLVWRSLLGSGGILIPGLRGLGASSIFSVMIIGWWIASSALNKNRLRRYEKSETFLIFFILNLIMIMSIRGFSLAITGGYAMGGKSYVIVLIGLFYYFAASRITVRDEHVKWLLFGPLFFALIPLVAQIALYVTGGALGPIISAFVDLDTSSGRQIALQDAGSVRWSGITGLASGIFTLGLVLRFPRGRGKYVIPVVLVVIAILLRMSSGFRGATVGTVLTAMLWCIFMSRNRFATAMLMVGAVLAGWIFFILTVDFFPENMQRAVSFLPFVGVQQEVAISAQDSIDFRLDIWRQCVPHVKEFLLVGRGLVVDVKEWAFLQTGAYATTDFYYTMHNYHSGPLSLLLDTGLPGLFFGISFFLYTLVEGWKGLSAFADKTSLAYRYYFFLNISLSYFVFAFFFMYGDLQTGLIAIASRAALMRVLRYSYGAKSQF